jgi:hypothetical protein
MTKEDYRAMFVPKLRVYPHALREANAFYSPKKKALLFGYFPAAESGGELSYPGGIVFSCLSHDIVAHETAHAILDGIHPRFLEVTQPDGLAFHEAFADIVAMFQHFMFVEVVRHQIAKTRGDLGMSNLLGELAQEFGKATGNRGSLRDALGEISEKTGKWERRKPDPTRMDTDLEPHDRGAILVSAVFDAFVTIYESRIVDLKRIASGGSGILAEGELHSDLVNRLALEAEKVARHVLTICIRALDYCPPVDIDFGDYLRALITADAGDYPRALGSCFGFHSRASSSGTWTHRVFTGMDGVDRGTDERPRQRPACGTRVEAASCHGNEEAMGRSQIQRRSTRRRSWPPCGSAGSGVGVHRRRGRRGRRRRGD